MKSLGGVFPPQAQRKRCRWISEERVVLEVNLERSMQGNDCSPAFFMIVQEGD